MAEILSDDEITKLLNEVNTAPDRADKAAGNYKNANREKFSREHLRSINYIHEQFAKSAEKRLSSRLNATVEMSVASVDQYSMEEFIRTIPDYTAIGFIKLEALTGKAAMEIDPSIALAFIDKMSGGKGEKQKRRELTDNDKKSMEYVFSLLLDNLREAWKKTTDIKPRLEKIETKPESINIAPLDECAALITLETRMGDAEGMIDICIPYPFLEPVLYRLEEEAASLKKESEKKIFTKGIIKFDDDVYEGAAVNGKPHGK